MIESPEEYGPDFWDGRDVEEQGQRELRSSVREEARLFRAEVWCLVAVLVFLVVRQLWLA